MPQEQNRLLRQRNFELEAQSGQFTLHVATLQEQLGAVAEAAAQLQALRGNGFGSSNGLLSGMPKVPHSGSDIW